VIKRNKKGQEDYFSVMEKNAQKRHEWAKSVIAKKSEECQWLI